MRLFLKVFIHGISTTGGTRVPRTFEPSVHGTDPNYLVQFDHIEPGLGSIG